jgi:TDG/mug DNA glycosylase family protein
MPGVMSLRKREYYAHKGNAFWQIMGQVIGAGWDKPYPERVRILNNEGIAVWDVVKSCIRPGSRDFDIREEEPNDFRTFFRVHPHIKKIGLNGQKAAACFKKFADGVYPSDVAIVVLPSTSSANAWSSIDEKQNKWRAFMADRTSA